MSEDQPSTKMQIPDYAVFRCGYQLDWDDMGDAYERMDGIYNKREVYEGVMVGLPYALCWPPPARFTWDWKRLLSEADYQALSFPPGWQTELYRGVVLAWTVAEAEALPVRWNTTAKKQSDGSRGTSPRNCWRSRAETILRRG